MIRWVDDAGADGLGRWLSQKGPEALWPVSVALQWWGRDAQQLMEDRDGAGAASRWQYAEPGWSTSAPGELE